MITHGSATDGNLIDKISLFDLRTIDKPCKFAGLLRLAVCQRKRENGYVLFIN